MIPRGGERTFASEQLIGAEPDFLEQQDRLRIETVRTAAGTQILLGVVADGDGHANAGEAAQAVIKQIFDTVRQSKEKDLRAILLKGLISGNQAILGEGSRVAVTALAIRGNRYHLASAGHTKAFLIHEGRVRLIHQGMNNLLGISSSPQILTNDSRGDLLVPGDQIVLASDGLTKTNPADGKPFVDPKDLPAYVEGNSPREAARHILSIAMGRDVDDNVSVIVIQAPGKTPASKKTWIPIAVLAAIIFVGAFIVVILNQNQPIETIEPVDYGYAVVLSGSVYSKTADGEGKSVEKLGTVPPLSVVEAQEPTRLALQTRSESSTDVALISIYLSSRSKVGIQSIDTYQDLDGEGTRFQSFPTLFTYLDGAVLFLRSGGVRRLEVEVGEVDVSLAGAGRAIFGVRSVDDKIHVDCLQGGCTYEVETGMVTNIQAGQSLTVVQSSSQIIGIAPLPAETYTMWDDLCVTCLSSQ